MSASYCLFYGFTQKEQDMSLIVPEGVARSAFTVLFKTESMFPAPFRRGRSISDRWRRRLYKLHYQCPCKEAILLNSTRQGNEFRGLWEQQPLETNNIRSHNTLPLIEH